MITRAGRQPVNKDGIWPLFPIEALFSELKGTGETNASTLPFVGGIRYWDKLLQSCPLGKGQTQFDNTPGGGAGGGNAVKISPTPFMPKFYLNRGAIA